MALNTTIYPKKFHWTLRTGLRLRLQIQQFCIVFSFSWVRFCPFLTPPWQPGQIFMVQNSLNKCSIHTTTSIMFSLCLFGGILGPLNSVLAPFCLFRATFVKGQKHTFLRKWPPPLPQMAAILYVESQTLPRSGSKSWQMAIFRLKTPLRRRVNYQNKSKRPVDALAEKHPLLTHLRLQIKRC